jgi:hypothetical protein
MEKFRMTHFHVRPRAATWFFLGFLSLLIAVHLSILKMDPAYDIASWSEDLVVDEGGHSQAAQLVNRFGSWTLPLVLDMRPAAPLYNLIVAALFGFFGVHIDTLLFYNVALTGVTLLVAYAICLTAFTPWTACFVGISFGLAFQSFIFARLGLVEPTAIMFALIAVLIFVRNNFPKGLLISMIFAVGAAFTKPHFITVGCALLIASALDIFWIWHTERIISQARVRTLVSMILLFGLCIGAYAYVFSESVEEFRSAIASTIIGSSKPLHKLHNEIQYIMELNYDTKLPFMLSIACIFAVLACLPQQYYSRISYLVTRCPGPDQQAVFVLGLWMLITVAAIGWLDYRPTRYSLVLIFPILFIGSWSTFMLSGRRQVFVAIALMVTLTLQIPLYVRWLSQPDLHSKYNAFVTIAKWIDGHSREQVVGVIGAESATLGLFSPRILLLDVMAVPHDRYSLCDRLDYWRPRFHIWMDVDAETDYGALGACPSFAGETEVARERILGGYKGELALAEIHYR